MSRDGAAAADVFFMVEAKGKKGMAARQYQRTPPPMPKIEEDGNPRFAIFILANDEKEIQKTAIKQHRVLLTATEFRYGYKLVENSNMSAALSTSELIKLPTQDQLKTVFNEYFGYAKE